MSLVDGGVACFIVVFVVGMTCYREVERSVQYAHGYVVYESRHRKKIASL